MWLGKNLPLHVEKIEGIMSGKTITEREEAPNAWGSRGLCMS